MGAVAPDDMVRDIRDAMTKLCEHNSTGWRFAINAWHTTDSDTDELVTNVGQMLQAMFANRHVALVAVSPPTHESNAQIFHTGNMNSTQFMVAAVDVGMDLRAREQAEYAAAETMPEPTHDMPDTEQ